MYGTYFYAYLTSLRVLNSSFELNFQISSFSLSFSIEYWLATLVHCVLVSFIQIQFYFLRTNLQPFVRYINILKGWSHSEKEYSFGCEFFYHIIRQHALSFTGHENLLGSGQTTWSTHVKTETYASRRVNVSNPIKVGSSMKFFAHQSIKMHWEFFRHKITDIKQFSDIKSLNYSILTEEIIKWPIIYHMNFVITCISNIKVKRCVITCIVTVEIETFTSSDHYQNVVLAKE